MPRQSDEANTAIGLGFECGLQRAAFATEHVKLVHFPQVVHLPRVEMVGAQAAKRIVQQAERSIAGTLVAFRRQEHAIAAALARRTEGLAVVVLTLLVRRSGVAVADAKPKRF